MKIELGDKVKCRVSGHTGIVTSMINYLNGCVQAGVQAPIAKDKKWGENMSIDISQLAIIKKNVLKAKVETARGGPSIRL